MVCKALILDQSRMPPGGITEYKQLGESHYGASWDLCRASLVAQMVRSLLAIREIRVQSLGWKDPLEKEMAPTPVLLSRKSRGRRSLVGYSPWGGKELDTT